MKMKKVTEVMIPLSEYAVVNEDESLKDAIKILFETQKEISCTEYKHRAVLVRNAAKRIVGKVGPLDLLRALEPKYSKIGRPEQLSKIGLSRFGLSNEFLNSMVEHYNLWDEKCDVLVRKASKLKVKDIMYTPGEGEYVNDDTPVSEAIHQFILGHHQSLLVLKKKRVIGVLRLTDVFKLICDLMVQE